MSSHERFRPRRQRAVGFMLGEHVTLTRALGVALISAGVVLVGQSFSLRSPQA